MCAEDVANTSIVTRKCNYMLQTQMSGVIHTVKRLSTVIRNFSALGMPIEPK